MSLLDMPDKPEIKRNLQCNMSYVTLSFRCLLTCVTLRIYRLLYGTDIHQRSAGAR